MVYFVAAARMFQKVTNQINEIHMLVSASGQASPPTFEAPLHVPQPKPNDPQQSQSVSSGTTADFGANEILDW